MAHPATLRALRAAAAQIAGTDDVSISVDGHQIAVVTYVTFTADDAAAMNAGSEFAEVEPGRYAHNRVEIYEVDGRYVLATKTGTGFRSGNHSARSIEALAPVTRQYRSASEALRAALTN